MAGNYVVFQRPDGSRVVRDVKLMQIRARLGRMRSRVFAWSRVLDEFMPDGYRKAMVTLTYDTKGTREGLPQSWHPNDIRDYMRKLLRSVDVFAYAWVIELMANGTPHYHIIVVYKGMLPYPDKSGMWICGHSNVIFNIRTVYYIVSYLKKGRQVSVSGLPKGCRLFSVWMRGDDLTRKLDYYSLSDYWRGVVDEYGWDALDWRKKPEWFKTRFVGTALTEEFAGWLAGVSDGDLEELP